MHQLNFDAQLETSPLINDIIERLVQYERKLAGIQRNLDEVNHKVGPPGPEFNSFGTYPCYVKCGSVNRWVSLGIFEEYSQDPDFNLVALPPPLCDLHTVLSHTLDDSQWMAGR